jgi:hypothetical protein
MDIVASCVFEVETFCGAVSRPSKQIKKGLSYLVADGLLYEVVTLITVWDAILALPKAPAQLFSCPSLHKSANTANA